MGMVQSTLRRATRSLWENFYFNAVSTSVIAAALMLMGVYMTFHFNVTSIADSWNRDAHISAYFDSSVSRDEQHTLKEEIQKDSRVESIEHVNSAEAQVWLKGEVEGLENILDDLGPDALPASLEINLRKESVDPDEIAEFAAGLESLGFKDVDYGQDWIQRFNSIIDLLNLGGFVMGLLILLAALFIVTNTVYLVVYSRRDELETQKLVGATNSYITIPFLMEGVVQGVIGSIFALGGLFAVHQVLVERLDEALTLGITDELAVLPLPWLGVLCLLGVVLGVGAALLAVTRFLAQAP